MPDTKERPPAPPQPKGTTYWEEGEDYVWDEGYKAWVHEQPDGAVVVWLPEEAVFISEADFLGEQEIEDPGQALRDAVAVANGDAIKAAQSGDTDAAQRAMQRLGDLRAQYAQWQQSIQPKDEPIPLPEGGKRVISEGGYDWAYDPATGDYTKLVDRTPEKPKRSADQMTLDYYEAGDFDSAFKLDAFLDEIERPRGLTPAQAAQMIMNLAVAPDEAREWIDALTSDWNSTREPEERVESPGKALLPTDAEKEAEAVRKQQEMEARLEEVAKEAGVERPTTTLTQEQVDAIKGGEQVKLPGETPTFPTGVAQLTDEEIKQAAEGPPEEGEEYYGGPSLSDRALEVLRAREKAQREAEEEAPTFPTTTPPVETWEARFNRLKREEEEAAKEEEARTLTDEEKAAKAKAEAVATAKAVATVREKQQGGEAPTFPTTSEEVEPWLQAKAKEAGVERPSTTLPPEQVAAIKSGGGQVQLPEAPTPPPTFPTTDDDVKSVDVLNWNRAREAEAKQREMEARLNEVAKGAGITRPPTTLTPEQVKQIRLLNEAREPSGYSRLKEVEAEALRKQREIEEEMGGGRALTDAELAALQAKVPGTTIPATTPTFPADDEERRLKAEREEEALRKQREMEALLQKTAEEAGVTREKTTLTDEEVAAIKATPQEPIFPTSEVYETREVQLARLQKEAEAEAQRKQAEGLEYAKANIPPASGQMAGYPFVDTMPAAGGVNGIMPAQLAGMPEPYDYDEAVKKAKGQAYHVKLPDGGKGYLFQPTKEYEPSPVEPAPTPVASKPPPLTSAELAAIDARDRAAAEQDAKDRAAQEAIEAKDRARAQIALENPFVAEGGDLNPFNIVQNYRKALIAQQYGGSYDKDYEEKAYQALENLAKTDRNRLYSQTASGDLYEELKKKRAVPTFQAGGVVPGPTGQSRLVLAEGGETVLTPEQIKQMLGTAGTPSSGPSPLVGSPATIGGTSPGKPAFDTLTPEQKAEWEDYIRRKKAWQDLNARMLPVEGGKPLPIFGGSRPTPPSWYVQELPPSRPSVGSTPPQATSPVFSVPQQKAMWKRGNQAQFEQALFGLPKPLSVEETLQQMWHRDWSKKQQALFEAKPVQRTIFK